MSLIKTWRRCVLRKMLTSKIMTVKSLAALMVAAAMKQYRSYLASSEGQQDLKECLARACYSAKMQIMQNRKNHLKSSKIKAAPKEKRELFQLFPVPSRPLKWPKNDLFSLLREAQSRSKSRRQAPRGLTNNKDSSRDTK